jgi:hypothetical protein
VEYVVEVEADVEADVEVLNDVVADVFEKKVREGITSESLTEASCAVATTAEHQITIPSSNEALVCTEFFPSMHTPPNGADRSVCATAVHFFIKIKQDVILFLKRKNPVFMRKIIAQ